MYQHPALRHQYWMEDAAIMSYVTSRLTGIPGVCHATFGPGATNLSTGVGEALLDRSSLIAFLSLRPAEPLLT